MQPLHFTIDGFQGYRSRFDHIALIQEVLEEFPHELGLQPAIPAFLLPYYNGVVPEDCGVSAFVFLRGGHFTVHTFSFREAYFADLVSVQSFDAERLRSLLEDVFPCAITRSDVVHRVHGLQDTHIPDAEVDFGPHVMLDIEDYHGPVALDGVFDLFDCLPGEIGMTPIMRPYVLKGEAVDGRRFVSAMTMIAESHISVHIWPDERRAYFDLFSCRFFDYDVAMSRLSSLLPGRVVGRRFVVRGKGYRHLRNERAVQVARSRYWLEAVTQRHVPLNR